ncbi:hypothetical protein LXL04_035449 [Taraxacum kok-saghyz]
MESICRVLMLLRIRVETELAEERTEDHGTTSSQPRRPNRGGFPYDILVTSHYFASVALSVRGWIGAWPGLVDGTGTRPGESGRAGLCDLGGLDSGCRTLTVHTWYKAWGPNNESLINKNAMLQSFISYFYNYLLPPVFGDFGFVNKPIEFAWEKNFMKTVITTLENAAVFLNMVTREIEMIESLNLRDTATAVDQTTLEIKISESGNNIDTTAFTV